MRKVLLFLGISLIAGSQSASSYAQKNSLFATSNQDFYKMKIFIVILLTFLSFELSAQQQDQELIKQTIETYFDGWMTGDSLKVGKVMHNTCNLKIIKENEVVVIDRTSYLSRFKLRTKLENSFGRIISIDITGQIASAKCELEIPERIFTDYFNMMKINDQWYIVDKISTSILKTK